MGNGTKGLMRKMEEVCIAVIKMQEAEKLENRFDKWSRKKLIVVFGLIQAFFVVLLSYILNRFGG